MPVLVVDAQSVDNTADLARAAGARVITRPFEGFVKTRLFALAQVTTPWTLMIDADEAPDEALRDAIVGADGACDGYAVSRTTFYCGKPLRLWRGERVLRLFRTHRARLLALPAAGGAAELHERWVCDGPTQMLDGTLLHFSYETHAAYREKFERYTGIEARGAKRSAPAAIRQAALVPARFLWYALRRGAIADGTAGVRIAWYSAAYPAVVAWKAWRRA